MYDAYSPIAISTRHNARPYFQSGANFLGKSAILHTAFRIPAAQTKRVQNSSQKRAILSHMTSSTNLFNEPSWKPVFE